MLMRIIIVVLVSLFFLISVQSSKFVFGLADDDNISFFLDKDWYHPRDSIHVQGWVKTLYGSKFFLEIINPKDQVIKQENIELQEDKEIDHTITTFGNEWNESGFYQIRISYGNETQTRLFPFGNFNANEFEPKIMLDKPTYSWTDIVRINVVSPNDNQNNHQIDKIKINISSMRDALSSYTLEETDLNTGNFWGVVTLTGNPNLDVNQDGRIGDALGYTYGAGPDEGYLSVNPNDILKVTFQTPYYEKEIETEASIQFTKAEVEWLDSIIYEDQAASGRVIDPDMNLMPESRDELKVLVTSYPQKSSKTFTLKETEPGSGIFEGKVQLVSQPTEKGVLARAGSIVFLKYEDTTLPSTIPTTKMDIISNVTISETIKPEKLEIEIPYWVKNTAKWWSQDSIGDGAFLQAIQYLIDKKIIQEKSIEKQSAFPFVPHWVKNTAKWWSQGTITNKEFTTGIQYLLENNIIRI